MTDATLRRLAAYATGLTFDRLPDEVVAQARRLIVDSLGCGLGAFTGEPSRAARDLAEHFQGDAGATVLGSTMRTTPELAAFVNGTMVRYLDFNDSYSGRDIAHPSDNLGAVLAAAEAYGATGRDLILGFVIAYEVHAAWVDTFRLLEGGPWDQPAYVAVSAPLGIGRVIGLSTEQVAHAVSMSVVQGIALGQARVGQLSHWKAAAVPNAGRNALFAAMLAEQGMTGPAEIFEGAQGYYAAVAGKPLELPPLAGEGSNTQAFRIMQARIKRYPCGFFGQTAIEAALEARETLGIGSGDEVARVRIRTFEHGLRVMAGDRSRWRPESRETADHSIPFVVAWALRSGSVDVAHFEQEAVLDPATRALMDRIEVVLDEECEAAWPDAILNIVTVQTTDGREHTARVPYYLGHFRRPMSDDDVAAKFRRLTHSLLTRGRQDRALDMLWSLEQEEDLTEVMRILAI